MIEAKKKYYRLYMGRYYDDPDGPYSEWDLYEVFVTREKAWEALRRAQANAFRPTLVPLRICVVTAQADDDPAEFDPWEDDGDETFIDEKGCGLAEWTRLHVTGEIDG